MLPVRAAAPAILDALRRSNRLVLAAPTGSGKTTQVPQILLEGGFAESGRVVVLQPRRLATRMVASRVAAERRVALGGVVGFQTRQERAISAQTRLAFLTEGLFVRQMLDRRDLAGVACVVLDEFHERSIDADLVLGMVRQMQESSRPDLKLVVMSATLDVERLGEHLGVQPLTVEGRQHPVTIEHVRARSALRVWDAAAEAAMDLLVAESSGDILVFMPGVYEINRTLSALRGRLGGAAVELHALHGSLLPAQQDRAVAPGRQRKIIVATNVAETSLTIEGVVGVIDSGLVRSNRFDPRRGLNVLDVGPISQASAEQRAGRAGRVRPGRCLRLWTVAEHTQRPFRDAPEIQRLELSETLLHLHALGVDDPLVFPWLDRPKDDALHAADALLRRLGALDDVGRLTARGRQMAAFPVHPRLGRFLVDAAGHGALGRAVVWAALASERDILERAEASRLLGRLRLDEPASDLAVRESLLLEAMRRDFDPAWMDREGLSPGACREAARTVEQLRAIARREGLELAQGHGGAVAKALLAPFVEHLAVRLDPRRPHCAMVGQRRVVLDPASVVRDAGPLLALEVREIGKGDRAETAISLATRVEEAWLAEVFGEQCAIVVEDQWNDALSAMEQVERRVLRLADGELELGRKARTGAAAGDAESAAAEKVERIMRGELRLTHWDERVEQWIRRVRLVADRVPERGLIRYDDDEKRVILHELVGEASRFSAVRDKPVLEALMNALSWQDQAVVREMAPESLRLENGFTLRLEYPPDGPPVGRAKIQQLYGVEKTPTICRGRQPVLLEILAPNQRPVQRTQDLANFWKTLYPEVKKELKRRYPKHEWR